MRGFQSLNVVKSSIIWFSKVPWSWQDLERFTTINFFPQKHQLFSRMLCQDEATIFFGLKSHEVSVVFWHLVYNYHGKWSYKVNRQVLVLWEYERWEHFKERSVIKGRGGEEGDQDQSNQMREYGHENWIKDIPGELWSVQVHFEMVTLCTLKNFSVHQISFYQPKA